MPLVRVRMPPLEPIILMIPDPSPPSFVQISTHGPWQQFYLAVVTCCKRGTCSRYLMRFWCDTVPPLMLHRCITFAIIFLIQQKRFRCFAIARNSDSPAPVSPQ